MTAPGPWVLWPSPRGWRCGQVRFRRRDYLRTVDGALVRLCDATLLPQGVDLSAQWPREFPKWELSPYRELPDAEALAMLARLGVDLPQGETA